jgi:hypothetical protein
MINVELLIDPDLIGEKNLSKRDLGLSDEVEGAAG